MSDHILMTEAEVSDLAIRFLLDHGLSAPHAEAVAGVLASAQRDGGFSHGLQRLPGTLDTMGHPAFNNDPSVKIAQITPAVVQVDAGYGFSIYAAILGLPELIRSAETLGIAFMAVRNGFHSTALWPVVEKLTQAGLVGLSMNPTHDWVAPAGGTQPVLGTNPIAFGWPRPGKDPYVFDFATTAASRADIALHRQEGKAIPKGWGLDAAGKSSTDPAAVLAGAMLPFGGHKGSAIATMIELMAGPMIGDRTSHASAQFDEGHKAAPCHGELIIAINPRLLGQEDDMAEAEAVLDRISGQGARLPGSQRHQRRAAQLRDGIPVRKDLLSRIHSLTAKV